MSPLLTTSIFLLSCQLLPTVTAFDVNGYWTYSPSFEALSGIKGIKKPGSGEENMFLIPERNSYKIGNVSIYQCKMCDFRTRHPQEYANHVREKHFFPGHEKEHKWLQELGMRQDHNYTCNVCGEIYKNDMSLLWHMTHKDHVIDDHDQKLASYLRARIQLNETRGRKVVYHPIVRPFYKLDEPSNESHAQSSMLLDLNEGYQRATFIPGVAVSSGDRSNQFADESMIKTGFSKYQKSDVEKRFKKVNGVNVYQRSPEEQEYVQTDESAEAKRLKEKEDRLAERREAKRAWEEQDTSELARKEQAEEDESSHSASYFRRQLDEYGPWASRSDKVGDKRHRRKTTIVLITKPDVNLKDPF